MEVYMDDMLMKSSQTSDHTRNLEEVFNTLRRHPIKCAFGVTSEIFFEVFVSQRGIKACLEKINAIINMKHPSFKKEIQQLNGRIVALNRFISRSTERCLSFFKILIQAKDFS